MRLKKLDHGLRKSVATLAAMIWTLGLHPVLGQTSEALAKAAEPGPCTSEPYRQFDFWLGDFRVENPAGTVVGENEITLHLGGCMLMESWKGASGMHGMSFNFYDPSDQTWNQVFVDNKGNPANWPPLKGKLEEDGSMVLWSPEGESRTRWTWKKVGAGKVRQMAEQTTDGGKTWRVIWDSYYVLKESD